MASINALASQLIWSGGGVHVCFGVLFQWTGSEAATHPIVGKLTQAYCEFRLKWLLQFS